MEAADIYGPGQEQCHGYRVVFRVDPDSAWNKGRAIRQASGGREQAHQAIQGQAGPRSHEKGVDRTLTRSSMLLSVETKLEIKQTLCTVVCL